MVSPIIYNSSILPLKLLPVRDLPISNLADIEDRETLFKS